MPALTTSGLNDFIAEIAKDNLTRYKKNFIKKRITIWKVILKFIYII